MTERWTCHLHTPEAVSAFRALLDDEPQGILELAVEQLERFRGRCYFTTGDPGGFTLLEIEAYLVDREATIRRFAHDLKHNSPSVFAAWADVSGYEEEEP